MIGCAELLSNSNFMPLTGYYDGVFDENDG